ncbi:hypothetical protein [Myceligenerans salitolerans]|uniref:Adhesin domain-containing protein n=1 Tax=Myceligenerans salitolerans TaxID=1230528 RepID=A0ABS3I769_9MICO|nr:hypothetical protein [Myceligenerans salitolerans]MBO0608846.1 hypothetical protein [Myceligenerans salitolerans]
MTMTTESWSVAAPQTIEVADTTSLTVRLTNGRAEIVADADRASGATIEVLEVSSRPLQVLAEHGTLRVAYDFPGIEGFVDRFRGLRDQDTAVVRITVPAAAEVDVATVGAEASVTGSRARVNVRSVTGAVAVTGTSGPLSVKSVSGAIVVSEHTGDVTVNQASGPATVSGGLGRVTVNGVSGPVDVASSGTTPLVSAKTVAGAVTIRLDAGTPVNLRARSVTGKVTLDGEPLTSTAQRTVVVDHPEAGATCYLSTNTVSGTTAVVRA